MRSLLLVLILAAATTSTLAAPITGDFVLRDVGLTTNPLIYDGEFDVYEVQLNNPNNGVTDLVLDYSGDFIEAGATRFKVGSELPVFFSFDAPDTFFVLPDGWVGCDNQLAIYPPPPCGLHAPDGQLPFPTGLNTIAVISLPTGSPPPEITSFVGQASVDGVYQDILFIPEPTTALLALFGWSLLGTGGSPRKRKKSHPVADRLAF